MKDVTIEFIRGSGPGGQHRNKVESGVRLRHASGLVIEATEERSQTANREVAFRRLEEALRRRAEEKRAAAKAAAHKAKPPASFGQQKRTYRLIHPAGVQDASGHFEPDVQKVLDGGLDGFLRRQNG